MRHTETWSSGSHPRVLVLAPRPCVPADTGAKLRNYHLARQLSLRMDVTFIAFAENAMLDEPASDLPPVSQRVILVPRRGGYGAVQLVKGLLGPNPVTVVNYTTESMKTELQSLLSRESFDVVQIEGHPLTAYVPLLRAAPHPPMVVLDWHNVDSENMRRYGEAEKNIPRRWYAELTASRIEHVERKCLVELDAHLTVSTRDRDMLSRWAPKAQIHVIENGVDISRYTAESAGEQPGSAVLFVGSMDYYANIDAVVWFAHEIWPAVRQQRPDLRFVIAGRSPGSKVRELASLPGVTVTGTVDDVRPYYRDAAVSVVPILAGSGSRLKILESMAAGVPVLSTTLGAEGIDAQDGVSIRIADTPEAFATALLRLYVNRTERTQLKEGGLKLVREQYDWQSLGETLAGLYREMTDRRAHAQMA